MNMITQYFQDLSQCVGNQWNEFWFVKQETKTVSLLRILVGAIALLYVVLLTPGLTDWFAANGILSVSLVYRLTGINNPDEATYYWSLFYFTQSPSEIWLLHVVGIIAITAFLLGIKTRFTSIIALIFVLSYAQRAPMLVGLVEPLLCPLMFYLCFAPCGDYFSVDAWLRNKKARLQDRQVSSSLGANIAIRLIQVHVCMFYAMMVLTKLGNYTWWGGESMWWLIAQNHSPMIDLRFLRDQPMLVFTWTHLVILFELCFPLLIWVKVFRPLLIGLSVLHWTGLSLVSGNWEFGLLMLAVNVAFFSPGFINQLFASEEKSETIKDSNDKQTAPAAS